MKKLFYLMHRDISAAELEFDPEEGIIVRMNALNRIHLPLLGKADTKQAISDWWRNRTLPESRKNLRDMLSSLGYASVEQYIYKNLGVSLTDNYWICPKEADLSFDDINLFDNPDPQAVLWQDKEGERFSNSPNASLNGNMEKEWHFEGCWNLYKRNETPYDVQQSFNELFATMLHEKLNNDKVRTVQYHGYYDEDNCLIGSVCRAFTSKDVEFIPAYELIYSKKKDNTISDYSHFINICVENGLKQSNVEHFMDYMVHTDFLMTNTDRHYNNFGILRNPETLEFMGFAPLFDFGNSMFFDRTHRYSRTQLLGIPVSGFYKVEEDLLRQTNRDAPFDISRIPTPDDVFDFYMSADIIDDFRVNCIVANYEKKREMLLEYYCGYKISLFIEKHMSEAEKAERARAAGELAKENTGRRIIEDNEISI